MTTHTLIIDTSYKVVISVETINQLSEVSTYLALEFLEEARREVVVGLQMVQMRQLVLRQRGGGLRPLQRQQRAHGARLRREGRVRQRAPARPQPARRHPRRELLLLYTTNWSDLGPTLRECSRLLTLF